VIRKLSRAKYSPSSDDAEFFDTVTRLELGGLRELMNLAWWHRIWTVQETVLPTTATILCGSLNLPWDVLARASSNFYSHHLHRPVSFELAETFANFYLRVDDIECARTAHRIGLSQEYHISWLFRAFQNRLATDRRDKIYALIGLLPHQPGSFAQLSHSASYTLNWREAYERTTKMLIRATGSLIFLMRPGEKERDSALATWVPDWSAQMQLPTSDVLYVYSIYCEYDSSSGTPLTLGDSSIHELRVKSVHVDKIALVETSAVPVLYETHDAEIAANSVISRWQELLESSGRWEARYPGGGSYSNAFWRTLASDAEINDAATDPSRSGYRRIRLPESHEMTSLIFRTNQTRYSSVVNRNFYITENGYIGLGEVGMEVGDLVYVLFGGKMPFVLRAQAGRAGCYSYIGHTYLHGFMDGEALKRGQETTWVTLV